jgi:hypothetical protein
MSFHSSDSSKVMFSITYMIRFFCFAFFMFNNNYTLSLGSITLTCDTNPFILNLSVILFVVELTTHGHPR